MFSASFTTLDHDTANIAAASCTLPDPLDDDSIDDAMLIVTHRRLTRLALVAAETGARFQREGVAHDPMAWMLAPLRLFAGAPAIEACLERDACMRAVLVHGLGLGLDADPKYIDALTDDTLETDEDDNESVDDADVDGPPDGSGPSRSTRNGRRLFTSTLVGETAEGSVHAFVATMATSDEEARRRLFDRHGATLAARARVTAGFDGGDPLVCALVSDVLADMLEQIALDPTSPLADGLDVVVEQRFAA